MAQLRQDFSEFQNRQADILVAGPENASIFSDYFRENGLPFIGLPDPQHSVLKLYGQKVNIFKLGRMPAQVLIDKKGTVRYVHYGNAMSDIPENTELFAILDEMNADRKV